MSHFLPCRGSKALVLLTFEGDSSFPHFSSTADTFMKNILFTMFFVTTVTALILTVQSGESSGGTQWPHSAEWLSKHGDACEREKRWAKSNYTLMHAIKLLFFVLQEVSMSYVNEGKSEEVRKWRSKEVVIVLIETWELVSKFFGV